MDKYQIAAYLVSLHTLVSAQDEGGGVNRSRVLTNEYERNWSLLKDLIQKENEDETRTSDG